MRKRGGLRLTAAALFAATVVAGMFRENVWQRFVPPETTGARITEEALAEYEEEREISGEENSLIEVSSLWLEQYFAQLTGWKVPYDYRVQRVEIEQAEVLDALSEPYVQLDYSVYVASANRQIMQNLNLIGTDTRRKYTGQTVLRWNRTREGWELAEQMLPVQYQLQTPELQEEIREPQTEHYSMKTEEMMTYWVKDGVLYVTYDGGETFREVPDGYEKVCRTGNGGYNELLSDNSYVVTPEFTGFAAYSEEGVSLLFSLDGGQTWEENPITAPAYPARTFLSKTEQGCYVTAAVDRSLGSDYYGTWRSEDLKNWSRISIPERLWSNLDCALWTDGRTGYYAKGEALYMTADGGTSFRSISLPEGEGIAERLGFYPYDTIEEIYQENGTLYLVVGQGDDGDYLKDGKLQKALYQSTDGVTFTFVEEIPDDTPELAG